MRIVILELLFKTFKPITMCSLFFCFLFFILFIFDFCFLFFFDFCKLVEINKQKYYIIVIIIMFELRSICFYLIVSFVFIYIVQQLYDHFMDTLTTPLIINCVEKRNEKYTKICEMLSNNVPRIDENNMNDDNNINNNNNTTTNTNVSSNIDMKNELTNFIKNL